MSSGVFGKPVWHDLTVKAPGELLPFYEAVCNWKASDHKMGSYVDFDMKTQGGETVAGLCHARGENEGLPPVWLMYVSVPSLEHALAKVEANGGIIVDERHDTFAIIRDPVGTHLALMEFKA